VVKTTIGLGVIFVLLGVAGYLGSGGASWTALIPALLGAPLLLVGLVGLKPTARKHAMHAAVTYALLLFILSVVGAVMMGTGENPRSGAIGALIVMALLSGIYIGLCVRSFIRARKAEGGAGG